jgi:F-type H+-transporting ATPase subunit epsilon
MEIKKIQIKIATPEKLIYETSADSVTFPSVEGEMTVLPGHAPLVARIASGDIVVRMAGVEIPFLVVGGFAEVNGASVTILTSFAEDIRAITDEHVASARARADELRTLCRRTRTLPYSRKDCR